MVRSMDKKIIALLLVIAIIVPLFLINFEEEKNKENQKPIVEILYPPNGASVSRIVAIRGTSHDPDGAGELLEIEIMINDEWVFANGNSEWNYEWDAYLVDDGLYTIRVRAFDGKDYSEIQEIEINIENPVAVESDAHKWALFIAVSNFPEDNESKLGNGPLNLAEKMTAYFIENLGYSTNNIIILFDDGFIRADNGYGKPIETLQERSHKYDITYGGATNDNVVSSINHVVKEANKFDDSEIFVWIASHGLGDENRALFGGKILESSAVFLWGGDLVTDKDLGNLLSGLRSRKTCVIVDACYSGGFADRAILDFKTFVLLRSGIPKSGRVVMSGASKFRVGYCSTTNGPLFSQLWFEGLVTGDADGFKRGIAHTGRPTRLKLFKDGKVSVEEAFYYARYTLKHNDIYNDYDEMEPQINDQYPNKGILLSSKGMILGE